MLKKIWQSFVRWFRKLFGRGASGSTLAPRGYAKDRIVAHADLPPLDDTDREYLFMQLLEGVAHGWQQPRAIGFFNKIRKRVRKSDWLDWLERFGNNLLEAPVANYELAGRMVQLGQLDCGEIGDLAGDYGARLLDRQAEQYAGDLLPIMEFDALEFDRLDDQIPFVLSDDGSHSSQDCQFGEVPPELLIDNAPIPSPPSGHQSEGPTREITLEEFSAMLHQDPGLVAELAEQFGVETTDPQTIVNIVVAQMQQQVQQVSGDLTPPMEPEIPTAPPAVPTPRTPPEIPAEPPAVPTPTTPPEVPAPPAVPTPTMPPEVPSVPSTPPEMPPSPPEVPSVPSTPPEMPPSPPEVPSVPSAPPEMPPPPPEVPSVPSAPPEISPTTPTMLGRDAKQHGAPPPPPPFPKLEYKPEDPWQSNTSGDLESTLPEAANTPDRRGV